MINEQLSEKLRYLYGTEAVSLQAERYEKMIRRFREEFREEPHFFRAPGRTEIGGNHTDHQNGQVLAAAIDMDVAAAASASEDSMIRIYSEGFGWIEVDLERKSAAEDAPREGTAEALVYGMAKEMQTRGYKAGGFRAYVTSNVPEGAGLSSSAAFEMLIGEIGNGLFNGGSVLPVEMAKMAQVVENVYYGKPSGLMDQMASAMGGICRMDFGDPKAPEVEKLDIDFSEMGYCICITNTHGSHAEFTDDYAAVRIELAKAAEVFGRETVSGLSVEDVIGHSSEIREAGGDRAFLRAMHIAAENERVRGEAEALKRKDMPAFLDLVRRSGNSSYKLLQNVHVDRMPQRQELAVALAISEAVLRKAGTDGACRVHGGGFAGTIQAFVPISLAKDYQAAMDGAFGEGSCVMIRVCPEGAMQLI